MTHLSAVSQFGDSHAVTITLAMSALLFTIGLIGFLVRRNMILMFL